MIFDAQARRGSIASNTSFRILILVASALATNVDAGIFGITLPIMQVNLIIASATIGFVTFAASFAGMHIGRATGSTARGAIIGAAVGGTAGAIIGRQMDKQAEELDEELDKL